MGKCSKNIATKPQNHGFEKMRCRGHSTKWCLLARLQEHKTPPPKLKKSPGQKQKTSTQTHKKPRPKTKTHQNPQKGFTSTTPQASPLHEWRKGRAALPRGPFAIRGGWGDWSPHKKIKNLWGLVSPQKRQNWSIVANRGNLRKGVCLSNGIGLMNPF